MWTPYHRSCMPFHRRCRSFLVLFCELWAVSVQNTHNLPVEWHISHLVDALRRQSGGEWDLPSAPGELAALSANTSEWISKNAGVIAPTFWQRLVKHNLTLCFSISSFISAEIDGQLALNNMKMFCPPIKQLDELNHKSIEA
jgi:hypothetical protein